MGSLNFAAPRSLPQCSFYTWVDMAPLNVIATTLCHSCTGPIIKVTRCCGDIVEYIFEYFCHVHPIENNFNGILLFTVFDGKEHMYDMTLMPSRRNAFLNVSRFFSPEISIIIETYVLSMSLTTAVFHIVFWVRFLAHWKRIQFVKLVLWMFRVHWRCSQITND